MESSNPLFLNTKNLIHCPGALESIDISYFATTSCKINLETIKSLT